MRIIILVACLWAVTSSLWGKIAFHSIGICVAGKIASMADTGVFYYTPRLMVV